MVPVKPRPNFVHWDLELVMLGRKLQQHFVPGFETLIKP